MLEDAFARWQQNGAAANFPLLVAAASPRSAVVFHSPGWPDADGRCEPDLARHAVLMAIEMPSSTEAAKVTAPKVAPGSNATRPRFDSEDQCRCA
jgi:hypothetical protein